MILLMKTVRSVAIIYKDEHGQLLEITPDTWKTMLSYRQGNTAPEAGGLLLGRIILETGDAVVDEVTTPLPQDRRKRFRFYRSNHHQKILDKVWRLSSGTCNYLGEWHTHPEDYPTPSKVDWDNWRLKLLDPKNHYEMLFFIIIGEKAIRVWCGYRVNASFSKMAEYGKENE